MSSVENALENNRTEIVQETVEGETPSNPSWERFSDYIDAAPGWSPDLGVEQGTVSGAGDIVDHFRGAESNEFTIAYWMQRHFIDAGGSPKDPIGYQLQHIGPDLPSFSVVDRREFASGGVENAGYRLYTVAKGAFPTSGTAPGDPSSGEPILLEVGFEAKQTRSYVIHQPSNPTSLAIWSDDSADTVDVIVEDDDAATTETVTLPGASDANAATTTAAVSSLDVVEVPAEQAGDIFVSGMADPASSTTLGVKSTATGDTGIDVVIENEDGSKTDTITTDGTDGTVFVTGATSLDSIGQVTLSAAASGRIEVYVNNAGATGTMLGDVPSGETYQTGSDLVERGIAGTTTDGVESDDGIPALGTGSHASAIGNDPEQYTFLATDSTFSGGPIADQIHGLDLSIEFDTDPKSLQGTRQQAIEVGLRTVSVDADTAGKFDSHDKFLDYMRGVEGDIVYTYPDGTVTVKNAQAVDADERNYEAEDATEVYATTYEGHGQPAVTVAHN